MTLERKLQYTRDKLIQGRCSDRSAVWYRHEIEAFEAAIQAMHYHRFAISGEDAPLELLKRIIAVAGGTSDPALSALVHRAKVVLDGLRAP
jgi:hypothetical protein